MTYESRASDELFSFASGAMKFATAMSVQGARIFTDLIEAALRKDPDSPERKNLEAVTRNGEAAVYPVFQSRVEEFTAEAGKYGLNYCVIAPRDVRAEVYALIVSREDKNLMNRIYEKLDLGDAVRSPFEDRRAQDRRTEESGNCFTEKQTLDMDRESVRAKMEEIRAARERAYAIMKAAEKTVPGEKTR